ncbi:MAG: UDP-N-acetylmuramate dehydrogenase [bacterium]
MSHPKNTLSLAGVLRNVPLAPYSWIRIGGPAEYFFTATSVEELQNAILAAGEDGLPVTVLGGFSKVLISDNGIPGLVVRAVHDDAVFQETSVTVGAGYRVNRLALKAAEASLSGLEFSLGIPGTIGGATTMNAGCFGKEFRECIEEVTSVDHRGTVHTRGSEECGFGYRTSIFQENGEIILSVRLRLEKGNQRSIREQQKKHMQFRREHQPWGRPTLGSTFCNVEINDVERGVLERHGLEHATRDGKLGAGALIDSCGLKGFRIGDVRVSPLHANFLENCGRATAEHVCMLCSIIKQKVRTEFGGVQLKQEIIMLGF